MLMSDDSLNYSTDSVYFILLLLLLLPNSFMQCNVFEFLALHWNGVGREVPAMKCTLSASWPQQFFF
jgi:hypothetical protein